VALLLARAGALTAAGQFADSHEALLEGVALVPDESIALSARLTRACAAVEHLLGQHEKAHARLTRALDALPEPVSPEGVDLMIELALNASYRARYEPMREWGKRAVAAARRLGDTPRIAAALAMLAFGSSMTGAGEQAQIDSSEAAALVDALADD
jgi:hypothetical protein